MSRIGRLPIKLPAGVTAKIEGTRISIKGPKGELNRNLHPEMQIKLEDNQLLVSRPSDSKEHRALHGLTRSLVNNMVLGVTGGFEKSLEVVGVGYRVEQSGTKLLLRVGLSHPLEVTPMPGITLAAEGTNKIHVKGIDKEAVGEMADKIRSMRLRDSFKGKGIKYAGETVRLKPGKAGKVVGKK
ncbi:MAG: 50S ribosomal protein L6 [Dehalococcoidales bacterium]|nr:50S ribosomal protein L6 [Dehalococcoidales bacterium]